MDKIERKNLLEQQRKIKPGECIKYIRVNIDPEFLCGAPGSEVLSSLANLGVKFNLSTQKTPRTILWERFEEHTLKSTNDKLGMSNKCVQENFFLYLMYGEEFVDLIKEKSLKSFICEMLDVNNKKTLTLIIFGLKQFCGNNNNCGLSQKTIESELTEIQIFHNVSHRLHETAGELAATVSQYTKAISEIPFKQQQAEKYEEANFFASNDNKDCVRVDGTAGLSRLWQQHLTRLPMITLETAEAIINEYPCPKSLLDAYEQNPKEAENLLADIKIRRAGGPLQSVRRIGPELSRKIFTLYHSTDPNEKL